MGSAPCSIWDPGEELHKPDLENWATGKDSFGFGITAWEATVLPEAWKGVLQAGQVTAEGEPGGQQQEAASPGLACCKGRGRRGPGLELVSRVPSSLPSAPSICISASSHVVHGKTEI